MYNINYDRSPLRDQTETWKANKHNAAQHQEASKSWEVQSPTECDNNELIEAWANWERLEKEQLLKFDHKSLITL